MTKIWVVKHALSSKGIFEIDAEIEPNGFVSFVGRKGRKEYLHGEGREWCRTHSEALQVAEKMRTRRADVLRRALGRLESLSFAEACHG